MGTVGNGSQDGPVGSLPTHGNGGQNECNDAQKQIELQKNSHVTSLSRNRIKLPKRNACTSKPLPARSAPESCQLRYPQLCHMAKTFAICIKVGRWCQATVVTVVTCDRRDLEVTVAK